MEPEKENNLSADRIEAIEMLTEGRGLAFQLRDLFLDDQTPVSEEKLAVAEDLLEKIHGSFTSSISALDLASESDEVKSEECWSGESSKSAKTRKPSASSSKRSRKTSQEDRSWTEVASSLVDDGHAWRKYGQKPILNAKYFRNYYKCTHKDHLGCPAKKHVQQISDDPPTYKTVYTFTHTCTNITLNPPAQPGQMGLESAAQQDPDMNLNSSFILNFQSNQHNYDTSYNNYAYFSPELNQEHMTSSTDQAADHRTSVQHQQGSSYDIPYSQDAEDPAWFPLD